MICMKYLYSSDASGNYAFDIVIGISVSSGVFAIRIASCGVVQTAERHFKGDGVVVFRRGYCHVGMIPRQARLAVFHPHSLGVTFYDGHSYTGSEVDLCS